MEVNNWFHFTNIAEMCPEFRAFAMLLYASKRLRYLCDSHAHIVLSIITFHRWPSPWFGTSMALKAFCTCSAYFTQSGTKRETWGNKLLRNTKLMNKKQRSRRWWWRRFKLTHVCINMHCSRLSEMISIFRPVKISGFREYVSNFRSLFHFIQQSKYNKCSTS